MFTAPAVSVSEAGEYGVEPVLCARQVDRELIAAASLYLDKNESVSSEGRFLTATRCKQADQGDAASHPKVTLTLHLASLRP